MKFGFGKMVIAAVVMALAGGASSAMQNPLLSGVKRLEIFCPFSSALSTQQQKLMCGLLQTKASSKFGFPAKMHLNQSGTSTSNGLATGYLELVLRLETATDKNLRGKLSWRNAKPMLGVNSLNNGKTVSLKRTADLNKDADVFIDKLLDTIPI